MTALFKSKLRLIGAPILSLALLVASAFVPITGLSQTALAGNYNSGVKFGTVRSHRSAKNYTRAERRAIQRLGYRKKSTLRAGVYYGHKHRSHRKVKQRAGYYKHRDQLFIDRRQRIAERNRAIKQQRAGVRVRNSGAGILYVTPERQGSVTSGYDNVGVAVSSGTYADPCPTGHNCGYRLYADGTGPRIITPGTLHSNDLPAYDGLSGPKVITLED